MNETIWQKCQVFWPRRTIDDRWAMPLAGQIWRRRINGRWQYKQDELTYQEWEDRQW